jgi:beta-galactosidase
MLAFKHFVTESYRKFQQLQLDILHPHLGPDVWVTHNFMGWFDGFDHYSMSKDLDLASWDWYIGTGHHDYLTSGATHDLTRGFKRRNFWLIETQPGNVNWSPLNNALNKGEARATAWHTIAHGADAVLYWQWRSALGGQEQYHGTLVDQSGQPRPFCEEVQHLGHDFATVSSLLADSAVISKVALLNSYDSRWSIQWQRHHHDFDYVAHFNHYYRPLAVRNIAADIISADAPLDGYLLVIAPALLIANESQAKKLRHFAERGGHLVLTVRCGMKDEYNALLPSRQPGPLADLAGVEVEEYYALLDPVPVKANWFDGVSRLWAERLRTRDEADTHVAARYGPSNGWLDDQLAVSVHSYGKGLVYYVGAYLDERSQQALIDHIVNMAGVKPAMETPTGVEARRRVKAGGESIVILINHEREEQIMALPWPAREHLAGQSLVGELTLGPYGVAVLTRSA